MSQNDQRNLTARQKAKAALEAACAVQSIEEIAQKYGVHANQIRQWKQELLEKSASLFTENLFQNPRANPCIPPCNDANFQLQRSHNAEAIEPCILQITAEQMKINEVLVFKIFKKKHAEKMLRQSKKNLHQVIAHQEYIKEKERKRIAREIHDDLGQNLLALKIDISMLHARTTHCHPRLHEKVSIALNNINTTIQSVKSIIHDLRPFELELGLSVAVEWQLKAFERISGIAYQLSIDEATFADTLSNEQTLAIFRILQEALSNIARHSLATKAEVTFSQNGCLFSMTVKDNGIGMQSNDKRKRNSFGIIGMKERVNLLGGKLIINSSHGNGTNLSISIPAQKRHETLIYP